MRCWCSSQESITGSGVRAALLGMSRRTFCIGRSCKGIYAKIALIFISPIHHKRGTKSCSMVVNNYFKYKVNEVYKIGQSIFTDLWD